MAKLAEKGKITSIFFADTYGVQDHYQNSADAAFRAGSVVGTIDPVTVVAAMASVTKSVSFAITGSTSYIREYEKPTLK
jgi:alkanesulfonate monooxygenase SsuD/methylene tetrahydromethanopterin reductase-like flavin-dependent oxidoreductase (luciferase family)